MPDDSPKILYYWRIFAVRAGPGRGIFAMGGKEGTGRREKRINGQLDYWTNGVGEFGRVECGAGNGLTFRIFFIHLSIDSFVLLCNA